MTLADHMTEAQWQKRVTDYAALRHLRVWHDNDSRRNDAGLPDLLIVGPGGVAWLELKSAKGRVRREQAEWLADLRAAGQHAHVYRPEDWSDVKALLDALAGRGAA